MSKCSEWKRLFFAGREFKRVEDLVLAAARGENAQAYVEAFLSLGHRPRRRRTVTDIVMAMSQESGQHWVKQVLSGLWLVYSAERTMWKSGPVEETSDMVMATRGQRELMRGSGWSTLRRKSVRKVAERNRAGTLDAVGAGVYMLWMDNYNKFRYSRNPNEDRDLCINATVYSLLPLPAVERSPWISWPTIDQLRLALGPVHRHLEKHHKEFNDRVRTLIDLGLQYEHIRVPCDLRRFGVTTMPWRPHGLTDDDIKSTDGLVGAVEQMLTIQQSTMGLCCLLVDVNIFWRVLKLAYSVGNVQCNVVGAINQCVPVLGVWHAYAHSVKKVYEHFLPWWAALEIPGFVQHPVESIVYTKPRLIVIEHLVMGLFLAAPAVVDDVKACLAHCRSAFGDDSMQVQQCFGLLVLCTEYCPAIVELGMNVRQCFWKTQAANTGNVSRLVLRDAIVLLHALHGPGTTEYIRNLMVMEVMWTEMHSALPAAAFVEECLESSLSVLARRKQTDTRAHTVQDFSDMYILVRH
jgi:hypothetical protein